MTVYELTTGRQKRQKRHALTILKWKWVKEKKGFHTDKIEISQDGQYSQYEILSCAF